MRKNVEINFKSVLFLGIGGVSMFQLANAFKNLGCNIVGYDAQINHNVKLIKQMGVDVYNRFNKAMLNVDMCVKTAGISDNSKLVRILEKHNVRIVDRAQALSWLCSRFKTVIAVSGTHGKTTTCALIYHILRKAGRSVSCHIGGEFSGARFNLSDEYLVVEACEFNKSFLHLYPDICVVTNIEKEHLDCYENIFNLRYNFIKFLKRGKVTYVYNDKSTSFLKKYKHFHFVSKTELKLNPQIKGDYNLKNISVALRVCSDLGVEEGVAIRAVNSFAGVKRRCEFLGERNNCKIFTDYAHHPTELREFIKSFKQENGEIQIVFQPHTYSRTETFFKEFVDILKYEKNVCIFKEYSAREKPSQGKTAKDLFLKLKESKSDVFYCTTSKQVERCLMDNVAIAFVGAGDIDQLARSLIKQQ